MSSSGGVVTDSGSLPEKDSRSNNVIVMMYERPSGTEGGYIDARALRPKMARLGIIGIFLVRGRPKPHILAHDLQATDRMLAN